MARKSVWEAGKGYTESKANLAWLFELSKRVATKGIVPTEVMAAISKVSKETGIPEWFLLALAFKESSFDPLAENPHTGAFGLFQLMPREQRWTTDILIEQGKIPDWLLKDTLDDEFYNAAMSNPVINTLAAVLVLKSKGLSDDIDWDGNWKKEVYYVLAAYGGYANNPDKAKGYVEDIYKYAELFKQNKVWPVADGDSKITARFGQRNPNLWKDYHHGVDFGVPIGTPVYSAAGGVVTVAGWHSLYGRHVIISNGVFEFVYAHLSEIYVEEGETITAGTVIGLSGDTGNTTGAHLHFEVREGGRSIDPLGWLTH